MTPNPVEVPPMPLPKRLLPFRLLAVLACLLTAIPGGALALSRVKDLASIEGVRANQLVGYGIVVGLNGTGGTLNNIPFTKQSLQAMLISTKHTKNSDIVLYTNMAV